MRTSTAGLGRGERNERMGEGVEVWRGEMTMIGLSQYGDEKMVGRRMRNDMEVMMGEG